MAENEEALTPLEEFRQAYVQAIEGLEKMSRLWESASLADYIESRIEYLTYLPSFDEFTCDFSRCFENL